MISYKPIATSPIAFVPSAAASNEGVGTASGVATVSGVGASTAAAVGSSAGVATVSGVGSTAGAAGTSAGVATVSGVGASTAAAAGSSAGVATVSAVGSETSTQGAGTAAGTSSAVAYDGSTYPVVERPASPAVGSGGGAVATYDNDWSSFPKRKKKRKRVDTDGPPVTDPAPVLAKGPPRSTKDIVAALLKAPSQVEGPKVLEVVRPEEDDDDEEVLELLLSAL